MSASTPDPFGAPPAVPGMAGSAPGLPAIRLERLTKRYGGRAVVDDLDLTVLRGEIFALLGPNGAGKTTTLEMIEGHRVPDSGSIRVLNLDPRQDGPELRRRIGPMLQRGGLYDQIEPIEALELFAAFYPNPQDAEQLLRRVGLNYVARNRYRTLSGGERQRLNLALALVGRPELLVLDEPTAEMDPQGRRTTWEMLREAHAAGATILLATHFLDEAEQLADRVAIIDRGRLVALGTPAELRLGLGGVPAGAAAAPPGGFGGGPALGPVRTPAAVPSHGVREIRLETAAPLDAVHVAALGRLEAVASVRIDRPRLYTLTTTAPGALLADLGHWLWATGVEPLSIRFGHASLEDVFLRLTGEQ